VVLADGRSIRTGGPPRQAVGPDLTQLFVGSEGTLGVITAAELRVRPAPTHTGQSAYGFPSFPTALDCMRRILRRGVTPAALRLYDATEAARSFETTDVHLLLAYDEGDPAVVDPALAVIGEEAATVGAETLDAAFVDRWLAHRNDVSALEPLIAAGYVVDTMEVSGRWSDLARIHEAAVAALLGVKGTITAFAHQSHSYIDGGCLYFTFGGQPDDGDRDRYYRAMWDAGQRAVLANGGSLSHHHGIGLNRARFMVDALGPAFDVLLAAKAALDPNGILNPGKLGLPDPFGSVEF
jgi:alkyldihydroxyacetonephosphate synthase